MRIILILPVLLLGACQVSKDNANNTVSVTLNEDVAANTAADIANTAQNVAADVGNEAKSTGEKIDNKVDADKTTNSTTTTRPPTPRPTSIRRRLILQASAVPGLPVMPVGRGWSGRQDSNLRPSAPKADALPDCATPRCIGQSGTLAGAEEEERLAFPCLDQSTALIETGGGPGRIRTSNLAVMSGRLYR